MSSLPLQKPDPPVSSLPLPPSSPPRHGVHLRACPVLAASARPRLPRHDAAASPRCVRPATPWPPRCVRPARRATTAAPARQRRELHGEPAGAMATGPSSIRTPGRAKVAPPRASTAAAPARARHGRRGARDAASPWRLAPAPRRRRSRGGRGRPGRGGGMEGMGGGQRAPPQGLPWPASRRLRARISPPHARRCGPPPLLRPGAWLRPPPPSVEGRGEEAEVRPPRPLRR